MLSEEPSEGMHAVLNRHMNRYKRTFCRVRDKCHQFVQAGVRNALDVDLQHVELQALADPIQCPPRANEGRAPVLRKPHPSLGEHLGISQELQQPRKLSPHSHQLLHGVLRFFVRVVQRFDREKRIKEMHK